MVRVHHQKGGAIGAKRYFWLKLMGDFFDKTEIRLIEKAPNGKELKQRGIYPGIHRKEIMCFHKNRRYFIFRGSAKQGVCLYVK